MKIHHMLLLLSFTFMVAGTFSIEEVSVIDGMFIITEYDSWGVMRIREKRMLLVDIISVETHARFSDSPCGGTCYDTVVRTTDGPIMLRSFSCLSSRWARRYRSALNAGIRDGAFFARRISNCIPVYGSLACLGLWFLVDRRLVALG